MVSSFLRLVAVFSVIFLISHFAGTRSNRVEDFFAQCPTGRYGDDCTCTSDLDKQVIVSAGTVLTCSNGVWNSTGPVVINKLVDMQYDGLFVPTSPSGVAPIKIMEQGNLTMHVRLHPEGTVDQAHIETAGELSANGTIHLIFDRLEGGIWTIQFAVYQSLLGSVKLGASSNATEFTCRTFTAPATPVFGSFDARYNFTVTNTASKCGFNKGSRDWALWTFIAIASFGGLLIVFTIFTCVINPWRKLIWYPPM